MFRRTHSGPRGLHLGGSATTLTTVLLSPVDGLALPLFTVAQGGGQAGLQRASGPSVLGSAIITRSCRTAPPRGVVPEGTTPPPFPLLSSEEARGRGNFDV